jgi:thymidylate kinase
MLKIKGLLITIMGINNVGKTTQQNLILKVLKNKGYRVVTLKYPIYELEPTGPRCNSYLRKNNPEDLTPKEFQKLCAQNRFDFQKELEILLQENHFVVAEMYTGSGICFGMADGIDKNELIKMNKGLIIPDKSILLDGERFLEAKEESHNYEQDDKKMDIIRQNHLELAKDFSWSIVNANQKIEKVQKDIIDIIFE